MNVLLSGHESLERVMLLLDLTNVSSKPTVKALTKYLVNGMPAEQVCALYSIDKSNFNRTLKAVNAKAQVVERIKEIDWPQYQQSLKIVA